MGLEAVLLAIVVASAAFSVLGLLLTGHVYDRLHYLSGIGAVGIFVLAAAVWLREGASETAVKMIVIAWIIFLTNSVLTHATARAAWVRQHNKWDPLAHGVERMKADGQR